MNKETEYQRGFYDALHGKPCVATSMSYVDGYLFGQETARIGRTTAVWESG